MANPSKDIVTRLRFSAISDNTLYGDGAGQLQDEAADEIVRLRETLSELVSATSGLVPGHCPEWGAASAELKQSR